MSANKELQVNLCFYSFSQTLAYLSIAVFR